MAHKQRGRPTKLDEKLLRAIIELVEAGNYLKDAIMANDIDEATYYRWMAKGQEDVDAGRSSIYAELCKSAPCARAKARTYHVGIILKNAAACKDARASLEYLARTDPENWAKRDELKASIKHSGNIDSKVEVNADDIAGSIIASDQAASELACALLERVAARKDDAGRTGDAREPGKVEPG